MQTNGMMHSRGGRKVNQAGYADVRTRHGEERLRGKDGGFDFIDFIEGQFGAILYSMVLFLLFFMVIFSTVMRFMLEKESHLRFFRKMQFIAGVLSTLALVSPFLIPYLHLCYKEVMLENHHHNRGTRLVIALNLTLRRAKRTIKTLALRLENKYRTIRGLSPKAVPSRYKLVV